MVDFKTDDRVNVVGRNINGRIAFIGSTHFSSGLWYGIVLDEPKGRNNGSVEGERYFKCPRNHGLFVRACQLEKTCSQNHSDIGKYPEILFPKISYPNYLRNYKYPKLNESCSPDRKENMRLKLAELSSQVRNEKRYSNKQTNTDITFTEMDLYALDLENLIEQKNAELDEIKRNCKNSEAKLKITEEMYYKNSEDHDLMLETANNLRQELESRRKQMSLLKRQVKQARRETEETERNRRLIEMKFSRLKEITETAIIEKEIAEEKSEQLEVDLRDMREICEKLRTELDIRKEEMELQCMNGVPAVHHMKELEKQNKVLNSALLKLKEYYTSQVGKLLEAEKIIEKDSSEIEILKQTQNYFKDKVSNYENEVSELYDVIDGLASADEIVFQVIERNLDFERKIEKLHKALDENEEQLEVSEELEEILSELRTEYKEDINTLESRAIRSEIALNQKTQLIDNLEKTIEKYRNLTSQLRNISFELAKELGQLSQERKEAVTAAETLKWRVHKQSKYSVKDFLQGECLKIELETEREQCKYWSAFLPDNFFQPGGEYYAIQGKLFLFKMIRKVNLLCEQMAFKFFDGNFGLQNSEVQSLNFASRFLVKLYELKSLLERFSISLDCVDKENFLASCTYYDILMTKEKEIDFYLDSLCGNDIDRRNNLRILENTVKSFIQLFDTKFCPEADETKSLLECHLKSSIALCRCIATYNSRFKTEKKLGSEISKTIGEVKCATEKLRKSAQSILNYIKSCRKVDNVCLDPRAEPIMRQNTESVKEVTEYLATLADAISDGNAQFGNFDIALWEEIVRKVEATTNKTANLESSLQNGEYLIQRNAEPNALPCIFAWAHSKKLERENEIKTLRRRLSSSELEFSKLEQSLEAVKTSSKFVSSQKFFTEKDSKMTIPIEISSCERSCCSMVRALSSYLEDWQCTAKYLNHKYFELQMKVAKNQLSKLPPLKLPKKSKYHPEVHNLFVLQNKLNKLVEQVRSIIVPEVVDATKKGRSEKLFRVFTIKRMLTTREIQEGIEDVRKGITGLKTQFQCIPFKQPAPSKTRNFGS